MKKIGWKFYRTLIKFDQYINLNPYVSKGIAFIILESFKTIPLKSIVDKTNPTVHSLLLTSFPILFCENLWRWIICEEESHAILSCEHMQSENQGSYDTVETGVNNFYFFLLIFKTAYTFCAAPCKKLTYCNVHFFRIRVVLNKSKSILTNPSS